MQAMLKMNKIDIAELPKASEREVKIGVLTLGV